MKKIDFKINRGAMLKTIKVTALVVCVALIFLFGFILVTVQEISNKIEATKITKKSVEQFPSILEVDSMVNLKTLTNYLLYSDSNEGKNIEIKTLLESNKIEEKGSRAFILSQIELPSLLENDCSTYRCVQIRRDFSQIPSSVWKALLGTEDFRFLDHKGVDPIAIARAIVVDIIAMKFVQGGSTLTQQLVKNLFLSNDKKLKRKFKEIIYALYIENILDKQQILTLYLNEVFWGSYQGVKLKGFYAASLAYFDKRPSELNEFEATILVGLLKGPNFYTPKKGHKRIKQRAQAVFSRLQSIKLVSGEESFYWEDKVWVKWSDDFIKRNNENNFYSYYLASKNSDNVLSSFEKINLYQSVSNIKARLKPRLGDSDIAIKILIAKRDCDSYFCEDLFSFYSKFERNKEVAMTQEFHQVGSLFKPIVYETFVELGRSYEDIISTAPITLDLKSGKWQPKDYSKAKIKEMPLRVALQKSKNIPLIRVASEIGFDVLEEKLTTRMPKLKKPLAEYPAQLLGALELSMEEVLSTYNHFIKDKCSEIKSGLKSYEDSVLYFMSNASETTISIMAKGALRNARVFGKTGTSNKGLDNWYYAFDGKLVYVFWFGVESSRDKANLKRVSGANSSFAIFQDFINFNGKQISDLDCY